MEYNPIDAAHGIHEICGFNAIFIQTRPVLAKFGALKWT